MFLVKFNNHGIVKEKRLINLNNMNDLKLLKILTQKEYEQDNTIYKSFKSMNKK